MLQWGSGALPALRAFLEDDRKELAGALAQLDTDQQYWEQQRARLRGLPLARIAREREDIQDIRSELKEMADLIECASAKTLSRKQIGRVCHIYTRRGWPKQNELIRQLLRRAGSAAVPIVREHIQKEKETLPAIRAEIELAMPKVTSTPTRWRYDRAMAVSFGRGFLGNPARTY